MDTDLAVYKKDRETFKFIERALKSSVYLQQVISDWQALKAIINAMELKKVSSKTVVSEAGKMGKEMYICADGYLDMYDSHERWVGTIGPGDVFGEMAFICFTKRKRTVRAKMSCKLWVLHQSNYIKILNTFYTFQDEDYITFFKTIPVLREFSYESLLNIRKLVRVECYPPNSYIISEGEKGSDFFILTGGTALVYVTSSDGRQRILDQLGKGDFFGEGAILGNGIRNASVIAEAPGVECILLDKQHFTQFFADLELIREASNKRQEIMAHNLKNDIEYHFIKFEDLQEKGTISNCSLGSIELVQYKTNSHLVFALKILKKAYLSQNDLVQNALNEKDILISCRSPFIVRLYKTFKDDKHLYYLQQACLGGDLRYLLEQRNNFDDNMAKFIAACVIEALDYLHGKNIVYNNLETKNLVFDGNGYIKLVDFGMAKRISGTNITDMEPNDSEQHNSDPGTDFWFLGCLIYEMLVGVPPFARDKDQDGNRNVNIPAHVTKQAKNIIRKMWKQKSCKGGEVKKFNAAYFRNETWFEKFSWLELQNGTLAAPYVPRIQSTTDLSNFAKQNKDKEIPPDCNADWDRDF